MIDANAISSFTFIVISYNHEKYIIEHLESIKYLIESYADNIDVCIIISDDGSKDRTRYLVDSWLEFNAHLFSTIDKIYNSENLGTCKSVINCLTKLDTNFFKLTAGDDVYSRENIFDYAALSDNCSMLFGVPIFLRDGVLNINKINMFNTISTQYIYKGLLPVKRFKKISVNNAPNLIYSSKCILSKDVISDLAIYDVIEDWPLQISIAENFPEHVVDFVEKVFVYYRRTSGSSYIVANSRFYKDKVSIYTRLISSETSCLDRYMLRNRLFCFELKNSFLNKVINISVYEYILKVLFNFRSILKKYISIDLPLSDYQVHYKLIQERSTIFLKTLKII